MDNLIKKAQEVQAKITSLKDQLGEKKIIVPCDDGVVKVIVNGRQQVLDICINKERIDFEDTKKLGDLIKNTINQALDQSREMFSKAMVDIVGKTDTSGYFE